MVQIALGLRLLDFFIKHVTKHLKNNTISLVVNIFDKYL